MKGSSKAEQGAGDQTEALVKGLTRLGYAGLFQREDEAALDEIWNKAGGAAFEQLALNSRAALLAQFLAAEACFRKRARFPAAGQKSALVPVYVAALARNFTGTGNPWGLPGYFDGIVGEHLEALGTVAVAGLVKLLSDARRVYYVGSKESTTGNGNRYRVKDLAAYYLSRITGQTLELSDDPRKRDVEIGKLKKRVSGG